jgi:flavorubredoxin
MRTQTIFDDGVRRWVVFGRDPSRAQQVIDTNQYLVLHEGKGMLLDPGGVEIFPPFVASLTAEVALSDVESIFASHQDPDVISSLSLWRAVRPDIACYASWCWSGFITHFGGGLAPTPIPDEGGPLPLGSSRDLRSIPAHYCHSSGNLHVWDPRAKILFSGDMGAALVPNGAPLFVEDFGEHVKHMEGFHKRCSTARSSGARTWAASSTGSRACRSAARCPERALRPRVGGGRRPACACRGRRGGRSARWRSRASCGQSPPEAAAARR